jgi:CRISPR-associated protein (TIGR03984 family)
MEPRNLAHFELPAGAPRTRDVRWRDHGYLVWGEGNAGSAATAPGGWTRLTAARIGALWVPCEAGAKRRVEITAREYFERQAFGNVAFVRERLTGLREMPADAGKASSGRQG